MIYGIYVGINLTGYPPPPRHPGAFAPKCVLSPRFLHSIKYPKARPINDDVPGAGHLQTLNLLTQSSGLND